MSRSKAQEIAYIVNLIFKSADEQSYVLVIEEG